MEMTANYLYYVATRWMTIYAFLLVLLILAVVALVVAHALARGRMFEAAGESLWKAFVPFYSDYVLCRLVMGKGWYFLLGLCPLLWVFWSVSASVLVIFIWQIILACEVVKSYCQGIPMGILYSMAPGVAELLIGFGGKTYVGSQDFERQCNRFFAALQRRFGGAGSANPPSGHADAADGLCGSCGSRLPKAAAFCPECGAPVRPKEEGEI